MIYMKVPIEIVLSIEKYNQISVYMTCRSIIYSKQ